MLDELQIDPTEDYAILHEDGSVSIHFEGEGFRVAFEQYSEMFGDLPLHKEKESEDAIK